MDFIELCHTRESCRNFQKRPLEREKSLLCLEAARLGPSACNSQPWRLILVDEAEQLSQVVQAVYGDGFNSFAAAAPAFIPIVEDKQPLKVKVGAAIARQDYTSIDIGIAAQNICLAAASQGLGTCIMGMFRQKQLQKVFNIPAARKVRLVIALGYSADEKPRQKERRSFEKMAGINEYP